MANEAVKIENSIIPPVIRTVSDSTTIEKGTILDLQDPNTSAAAVGTGDVFGGIAAAEKVASDGSTTLSADMYGVYDLKVNAGVAVTMGALVSTSGANLIKNATEAEIAAGKAIGKAEEAGAVNEVIRVRLLGY